MKGLWRTSRTRTKLRAIRDSDYDWLLAIVFGPRFDLFGAFKAPRSFVEETLNISAAYQRIITTSSPLAEV